MDFAGTIVSIHPQTIAKPPLSTGQRVCGIVHGSHPTNRSSGAFDTYSARNFDLVCGCGANAVFDYMRSGEFVWDPTVHFPLRGTTWEPDFEAIYVSTRLMDHCYALVDVPGLKQN